jgi:hypothetical protein
MARRPPENGPGVDELLKVSERRQSDTLRQRLAWLSGAREADRQAVMEAIGYLMDRGLIVPTARAMNKSATIPAAERDAPSGGMARESAQEAWDAAGHAPTRVETMRARRESSVTDTAGNPVTSERFFEAG